MNYSHTNLNVRWKNVHFIYKQHSRDSFKQNELIEAKKISKFRTEDPKNYQKFVENIVYIKMFDGITIPKMLYQIPEQFFWSRCFAESKQDNKNESLHVNITHENNYDVKYRQNLIKRSEIFRNNIDYTIGNNFTELPFIENDADDLNLLINLSTHAPPLNKSHSLHSKLSDDNKLPILKSLIEKPNPELLVSSYVKEHILKLPLMLKNAAEIRELYTNCILKDRLLKKLFENDTTVFSKDLQDYINDFNVKYDILADSNIVKDEITDRDHFFHTSINKHSNDIIEEIENDTMQFAVFIKPFYIYYFSQIIPNPNLIELDNASIEETLTVMITQTNENINNPISRTRIDMMSFIATANIDDKIRNITVRFLPGILNVILKSLFSIHNKAREEACVFMAFLFMQSKLLYSILKIYTEELLYEIISIIFKAIENYQSTFEFYYGLIGYIMDNCPIVIILQAICDKAPLCKYAYINKQWPKFIVYACKHWPNESFANSSIIIRRIIDLLENYFMNDFLFKATKMALCHIGRRLNKNILSCTYYPVSQFPDK